MPETDENNQGVALPVITVLPSERYDAFSHFDMIFTRKQKVQGPTAALHIGLRTLSSSGRDFFCPHFTTHTPDLQKFGLSTFGTGFGLLLFTQGDRQHIWR
jgi:hypothetical protein